MQNLLKVVAKHKVAATVAVGAAVVGLYLYKKGQTTAAAPAATAAYTSAQQAASNYPASAQGSIPTDGTGQSQTSQTQIAQLEQAVMGLYALQTQPVEPAAASGGASTAPPAQAATATVLPQSVAAPTPTAAAAAVKTVTSTPIVATFPRAALVVDRTPQGTVVTGTNYKDVVDAAGGLYQNHVFQRGGYQGDTFVPTRTARAIQSITAGAVGIESQQLPAIAAEVSKSHQDTSVPKAAPVRAYFNPHIRRVP